MLMWPRFPKPGTHLLCFNMARNKAVVRWTQFVSRAEMRNDGWMPWVVHMKEIYKLNHWREIICFIQELGLQRRTSSALLAPNTESFLFFYPNNPFRGIIVTYWLPSWVCISPAFDLKKLASLNKAWKIDKYYCGNNLFTKIRLVCNDLMEFGFFMKGILPLGFKCLQ